MSGFRESVNLGTATIPINQAKSNGVDLGVGVLCGVQVPAAMTGTVLTFEVCNDNSTYQELRDAGTNAPLTLAFTVAKSYAFDPVIFLGWRYVKVVSNATEAAARAVALSSRIMV